MAKNNVDIKIEANTKQAAQGIDKLTEKFNKFAKDTNSSLSKFSRLGSAVSGVQAAFSMLTGAMGKAQEAINETIDLYNKQAQAEIQLESAAKNNPYLNAASVQSLKEYAGELQSISTFGDEELIPMMAQLAAAGRTQAEIQDIMSASVDIAASGTMSLDSAVKNLNKTYSGLSGELGEANPKIKALTTEQLKNGEAVKVMKAQYSGMAQNVAKATGGWKQFQNTLGDLKEAIGKNFAEAKNSAGQLLNSFLSKVVSGLTSANKEAAEFKSKISGIAALDSGTLTESQAAQKVADESAARLENLKKTQEALNKSQDEYTAAQERALLKFDKQFDGGYDKKWQELRDTAMQAANAFNSLQTVDTADANTLAQYKKTMDDANAEFALFEEKYKATHDKLKQDYDNAAEDWKTRRNSGDSKDTIAQRIADEENIWNSATESVKKLAKAEKEASDEQAKSDALKSLNDKASAAMTKYQQTMDAFDKGQEKQRESAQLTGQEIDEQSMAMARLNAMVSAYIDARDEAGSAISDKNPWSKARLQGINAQSDAVKNLAQQILLDKEAIAELENEFGDADLWGNLKDEISGILSSTDSTVNAQIELLEKLKETWADIPEAVNLVDEAIKNLKGTTDTAKTGLETIKDWWDNGSGQYVKDAMEIAGTLDQAMQEFTNGQIQRFENEKKVALANLEEQHDKGLVSDEEYAKEKEKIEKESAEKEYKLQLAQWASNVATTTGQIAMAVVSALANSGSPFVGIPMAAAVGLLGAAQLATLIGNKPVPPSYATGGVVGGFSGATIGNDNTYIHARNGEMMLNAKQQRNLFDMANGSSATGGVNIVVNNSASNIVDAQPKLTKDKIEIMIDARVNDSLKNGRYNASLNQAQQGMDGEYFGI